MQALFRAVAAKRPEKGLLHNSDRGSQYCAHAFQKLLHQFGMQVSFSCCLQPEVLCRKASRLTRWTLRLTATAYVKNTVKPPLQKISLLSLQIARWIASG